MKLFFAAVCLLLPLFASGCCTRNLSEDAQPEMPRSWPSRELILRHRVGVDIPGVDLPSFEGVMSLRESETGPCIRVVGLGGLGLTLFDMALTPSRQRTDFLHPTLARIPHVEDYIAVCVRSVWFASLPVFLSAGEETVVTERYRPRTFLEHTWDADGRRTIKAFSPEERWIVSFMPGTPQPGTILFMSKRPEYTVRIQLVGAQYQDVEERRH